MSRARRGGRGGKKTAKSSSLVTVDDAPIAGPSSRPSTGNSSRVRNSAPVPLSRRAQPPSPPNSPPPLGEAHPDILMGLRPANPLPSGEQPVPIYVTPTPDLAARLGLPPPPVQTHGERERAFIRAPNGGFTEYDAARPYAVSVIFHIAVNNSNTNDVVCRVWDTPTTCRTPNGLRPSLPRRLVNVNCRPPSRLRL
jgi:hypothetical protein